MQLLEASGKLHASEVLASDKTRLRRRRNEVKRLEYPFNNESGASHRDIHRRKQKQGHSLPVILAIGPSAAHTSNIDGSTQRLPTRNGWDEHFSVADG